MLKAVLTSLLLVVLAGWSDARGEEFGASTSFQPNEITPCLFVRFSSERVAYQWTMSVPVLIHDPYNGGRTGVCIPRMGHGILRYETNPVVQADA